jgi:hypothetical protein
VPRRVLFVPLALEVPFWEERNPEALAMFGEPLVLGDAVLDGAVPGGAVLGGAMPGGAASGASIEDEIAGELTVRLAAVQDRLAAAALGRDPDAFRLLVRGRAGVGGVYDRWRAVAARWRGTPFRPEHGSR